MLEDISLSLLDTSNPAISRTNDLMEKLEYLELSDPNFRAEKESHNLNMVTLSSTNQTFDKRKPPLAPTPPISTIGRKWKELDNESQESVISNPEYSAVKNHSSGISSEDASFALMQRKLGNISLESSTRIANVLRKSTSKNFS